MRVGSLESQVILNARNLIEYSYVFPYIRYCNLDQYDKPWKLKRRTIPDYEFILIVKGTGKFVINDENYTVNPGDLILLYPEIPHEAESITGEFSFFCMHFDIFVSPANKFSVSNNFETIPSSSVKYTKAILGFPVHISCGNNSEVQYLFGRIIAENQNKELGYNLLLKSLFIEFIIAVLRKQNDISSHSEVPDEIVKAREYIEKNLNRKITLTEIANHVHLQSAYFSTLFKKHMGINFSKYLTLRRLAEAKRLLLNTNRKMEDIALSTGFYDIHHFSNIFKKYEGINPTQYSQLRIQKNHRQETT